MRNTDSENSRGGYDLDFVVGEVPYSTRVTPVDFNGQKRFRVKINGGDEHMLAWDEELMSLKALDDDASTVPADFLNELSNRLVKVVDIGER